MLGTSVNFKSANEGTSFIINNRASQPLLHAQSPFYYISLLNVDGLKQADISYESYPLPNTSGEKSGDVFRRGKTITLSGVIQALSLGYLEAGSEFLQQMFAETTLRKLTWTRRNDGVEVYIKCRVSQDLSVVENFSSHEYRWPWVVGLRADYPYTYRASDNSVYPTWQV